MKKSIVLTLSSLSLTAGLSTAATTLLDNDFGAGADIGPAFQQVSNGLGSGTSNAATGVILTGANSSSNYGLNTTTGVDVTAVPGATGFTIDWTFSSYGIPGPITANGLFIGVVDSTGTTGVAGGDLWVNDPNAIGITIISPNHGNLQFVESGPTNDTVTTNLFADPQPSVSGLSTGWTISMTVMNDNSWSVSSTGLGTDIDASGSGLGKVAYADIADNLIPFTSIQGDGKTYTVDHVTITAVPEPSSAALLGLGGLALILRRRK